MTALEDLESNIIDLIDIFDPDQIMEAITEAFQAAAKIENLEDKKKLLEELAESLEDFTNDFFEEE